MAHTDKIGNLTLEEIENRCKELHKTLAELRDAYLELLSELKARKLTDRPN